MRETTDVVRVGDEIPKFAARIGLGLVILGIGPLLVAEALRKLGYDTVGFGMAWGLTAGVFSTIVGLVLLVAVAIYYGLRTNK